MAIVDRPRGAGRPGGDGESAMAPTRQLGRMGVGSVGRLHWNLSTAALYEEIVARGEARIAEGGAVAAETGHHTGRSPADKFVVREPSSQERIWWGPVNKPLDPERFQLLREA